MVGLGKAQSGHSGMGQVLLSFSLQYFLSVTGFRFSSGRKKGGEKRKQTHNKTKTKIQKSYLAGCGFYLVVLFPRLSSGLYP